MTSRAAKSVPSDSAGRSPSSPFAPCDRLPLGGLLALAMGAFITILTEALPAGLLPQMSADLAVSESLIGQFVTVYALGSLATAIPLTAATQGWRRRPLLLAAVAGFAIVNSITALSTSYGLSLAARFFAGVFAGLLWSLLAGYASRMVTDRLQGRAIAIAMVGTPLALSLGVPAGTWLGDLVGWRETFAAVSVMTLLLIGWIIVTVPDFPGQMAGRRKTLVDVFTTAGMRSVLFVTLAFVLAHNILYTYIAPFLAAAHMAKSVDLVLLIFGTTSLAGIWIVGTGIDRYLREMVLLSTFLFGLATLMLGLGSEAPITVYAATGIWGLAFGGAATLFQTASAKAAGDAADVAQAMIVTVWNLAIAGGGLIGGILLDTLGAGFFPWTGAMLLAATLLVAWLARQHGFPTTAASPMVAPNHEPGEAP